MIKNFLLSLSALVLLVLPASAHEKTITVTQDLTLGTLTGVASVHDWLYMAGQPDQETIKGLKNDGFEVVFNIRGLDEGSFDEKTLVEENGMTYYQVPLLKDGAMDPQAVKDIFAVIQKNRGKKILFHCSSGNRIGAWFAAHLIQDDGYETEAAISLGKQAGITRSGTEKMLRTYLASLTK
ncbi:MAG: dual specificity protein phosphatase family protein [Rhodobacteraceae bacterium]|nr:dual specificity protein phosphatase family protein [Paracoccaceae bacterium]